MPWPTPRTNNPSDPEASSEFEFEVRDDQGKGQGQVRSATIAKGLEELLDFSEQCSHEEEMKLYVKTVACIQTWSQGPKGFSILRQLFLFLRDRPCPDFCLKSLISGMAGLCLQSRCWEQDLSSLRLRSGLSHEVSLEKGKAAEVLACAFFCVFPEDDWTSCVNFYRLFDDRENLQAGKRNPTSWVVHAGKSKLEKLKCIANYFLITIGRSGVIRNNANNAIIFRRSVIRDPETRILEIVSATSIQLSPLFLYASGSIESNYDGIQVDFANKKLGGGTLGNGAAMEEILFACCPELILATFLSDHLGDAEALLVHGAERFSAYEGYGDSFAFAGAMEGGPRQVPHIVMLDALNLSRHEIPHQYSRRNINREIIKCLAGFTQTERTEKLAIISGKWGCGVFNGDPELKCIIQWISASACGRPLTLYTFGDFPLALKLVNLQKIVSVYKISVAFLYAALLDYKEATSKDWGGAVSVLDYVISRILCERSSPPPAVITTSARHADPDANGSPIPDFDWLRRKPLLLLKTFMSAISHFVPKASGKLWWLLSFSWLRQSSHRYGSLTRFQRFGMWFLRLWTLFCWSVCFFAREVKKKFLSNNNQAGKSFDVDMDSFYSDTD